MTIFFILVLCYLYQCSAVVLDSITTPNDFFRNVAAVEVSARVPLLLVFKNPSASISAVKFVPVTRFCNELEPSVGGVASMPTTSAPSRPSADLLPWLSDRPLDRADRSQAARLAVANFVEISIEGNAAVLDLPSGISARGAYHVCVRETQPSSLANTWSTAMLPSNSSAAAPSAPSSDSPAPSSSGSTTQFVSIHVRPTSTSVEVSSSTPTQVSLPVRVVLGMQLDAVFPSEEAIAESVLSPLGVYVPAPASLWVRVERTIFERGLGSGGGGGAAAAADVPLAALLSQVPVQLPSTPFVGLCSSVADLAAEGSPIAVNAAGSAGGVCRRMLADVRFMIPSVGPSGTVGAAGIPALVGEVPALLVKATARYSAEDSWRAAGWAEEAAGGVAKSSQSSGGLTTGSDDGTSGAVDADASTTDVGAIGRGGAWVSLSASGHCRQALALPLSSVEDDAAQPQRLVALSASLTLTYNVDMPVAERGAVDVPSRSAVAGLLGIDRVRFSAVLTDIVMDLVASRVAANARGAVTSTSGDGVVSVGGSPSSDRADDVSVRRAAGDASVRDADDLGDAGAGGTRGRGDESGIEADIADRVRAAVASQVMGPTPTPAAASQSSSSAVDAILGSAAAVQKSFGLPFGVPTVSITDVTVQDVLQLRVLDEPPPNFADTFGVSVGVSVELLSSTRSAAEYHSTAGDSRTFSAAAALREIVDGGALVRELTAASEDGRFVWHLNRSGSVKREVATPLLKRVVCEGCPAAVTATPLAPSAKVPGQSGGGSVWDATPSDVYHAAMAAAALCLLVGVGTGIGVGVVLWCCRRRWKFLQTRSRARPAVRPPDMTGVSRIDRLLMRDLAEVGLTPADVESALWRQRKREKANGKHRISASAEGEVDRGGSVMLRPSQSAATTVGRNFEAVDLSFIPTLRGGSRRGKVAVDLSIPFRDQPPEVQTQLLEKFKEQQRKKHVGFEGGRSDHHGGKPRSFVSFPVGIGSGLSMAEGDIASRSMVDEAHPLPIPGGSVDSGTKGGTSLPLSGVVPQGPFGAMDDEGLDGGLGLKTRQGYMPSPSHAIDGVSPGDLLVCAQAAAPGGDPFAGQPSLSARPVTVERPGEPPRRDAWSTPTGTVTRTQESFQGRSSKPVAGPGGVVLNTGDPPSRITVAF